MKFYELTKLVKDLHKGQKYGEHDYFDFHIMGVVNIVDSVAKQNNFNGIIYHSLLRVALFHDTIEDTNYTIEDLKKLELPNNIIESIDAITFKKDIHTRQEYYDIIKHNKMACIVKVCDALFNRNQNIGDERFDYYQNIIDELLPYV